MHCLLAERFNMPDLGNYAFHVLSSYGVTTLVIIIVIIFVFLFTYAFRIRAFTIVASNLGFAPIITLPSMKANGSITVPAPIVASGET